MTERPKATNPLNMVLTIIGAAGGWALARYCGANLVIPFVAALLFLAILLKTPVGPKRFGVTIAVTLGHATWFVLAALVTGVWEAVAIDIFLMLAGVAWIWAKPQLGSVLFLGLLQFGALGLNAFQMGQVGYGSADHRALAVHCLLRTLALTCLFLEFRVMRNEPSIRELTDPAIFE